MLGGAVAEGPESFLHSSASILPPFLFGLLLSVADARIVGQFAACFTSCPNDVCGLANVFGFSKFVASIVGQFTILCASALRHVCWCGLILILPGCSADTTVIVGQNKDAFSPVRRADIGRSDTRPDCIIPRFGKRPENGIHPPNKQSSDVFQEDVSGSYQASDAHDFVEESTSRSFQAFTFAGTGDVLARYGNPADIISTFTSGSSAGTSFRIGLLALCHL